MGVSPFQPDDSVLVVGAGPVCLGVIQVLKTRGARTIIVSEVSPRRQEFAKKFGASHILEPTLGDAVSRCKELCDGEGPAVVFDAAGVQAGLNLALAASRVRATIVNIAAWKTPAQLDTLISLLMSEKKYVGSMTYVRRDFEQSLGPWVLVRVVSGFKLVGKLTSRL